MMRVPGRADDDLLDVFPAFAKKLLSRRAVVRAVDRLLSIPGRFKVRDHGSGPCAATRQGHSARHIAQGLNLLAICLKPLARFLRLLPL